MRALKVPPAWHGVRYARDPNAALQVVGRDSKGREQRIYSARFRETQSAVKFIRIKALEAKFDDIAVQNMRNMRSNDSRIAESAACHNLIMRMGLRPGSDAETYAVERAYGATTLEGRHVIIDGDWTRLAFVGKKGVRIDLLVEDAGLARVLRERAARVGPDGRFVRDQCVATA